MFSIPPLRTRLSADDMTAGIDISDIPGKRGCPADRECRKIYDTLDAHKPVLWRATSGLFQKFVGRIRIYSSTTFSTPQTVTVNSHSPFAAEDFANRAANAWQEWLGKYLDPASHHLRPIHARCPICLDSVNISVACHRTGT
jgi:hypothetical protein